MKKEHRPQKLSTRREFILGTAGLALATVLPACSQTTKTVAKANGRTRDFFGNGSGTGSELHLGGQRRA